MIYGGIYLCGARIFACFYCYGQHTCLELETISFFILAGLTLFVCCVYESQQRELGFQLSWLYFNPIVVKKRHLTHSELHTRGQKSPNDMPSEYPMVFSMHYIRLHKDRYLYVVFIGVILNGHEMRIKSKFS